MSDDAIPTVFAVGELLLINWPTPKPASFLISADAFEKLVETLNDERCGIVGDE